MTPYQLTKFGAKEGLLFAERQLQKSRVIYEWQSKDGYVGESRWKQYALFVWVESDGTEFGIRPITI